MRSALLLALPLLAPSSAGQSSAGQSTAPAASPEARERWERLCAASGVAGREPLTAFHLKADVRNRTGVQSNDAHIDYRYLAPDCIRFALPSKNETGRYGPAPEQYWLKDAKQVVVLAGREFAEDRRAVDDMLALARNYAALANPARLTLLALELVPVPGDLWTGLAREAGKLTWLALESPDFALVRGEPGAARPEVYRVELGLRDDLPVIAIVRAKDKPGVDPLLVEFSRYEERDGYRIPMALLVHVLDRKETPVRFAATASQEVYVTAAALRPSFTVEDFKPEKR